MILHDQPTEFRQLIILTSNYKKIPEVYIEKDYYVTLALKELSNSTKFKAKGIFKGGTSLSKAYKLINRFSEDIDLGLLDDNLEEVGTKNAMRSLEKVLTGNKTVFTQLTNETDKRVLPLKHFRRSICTYPKLFEGNFYQASDVLLIEINRFTPAIPSEEKEIETYIAEYLKSTNQDDIVTEFQLEPFGINVMSIERTFTEKVLGIIKKSFSNDPITDLKGKIRHIYDIHFLIKEKRIQDFLENKTKIAGLDSFEFFKQVLTDELNAGFSDKWMDNNYSEAIIFKDLNETWEKLENEYNQNFANMVYGELPKPDEIKNTLTELGKFISNFDNWKKEKSIVFKKVIQTENEEIKE